MAPFSLSLSLSLSLAAVLTNTDPPRPFDFLVNDEFLRVSLGDYVSEHGIYTEEILPVEFVEAMAPPEPPTEYVHDDWISSVASTTDGVFLTGSYDNTARVWNAAGEQLAQMQGHEGAITNVAWLGGAGGGAGEGEGGAAGAVSEERRCLTASRDETVRTWSLDATGASACDEICVGHTDGVLSLAVQPTGAMFASGSADRTIQLWSTTQKEEDAGAGTGAARTGKRRRTGAEEPATKTPLGQLLGSTAPVRTIAWPERGRVFSAGDDHCIRVWDVETATNTATLSSSKVINDIAVSLATNRVAAGCFDGIVRMFDPRADAAKVVTLNLKSHKRPVTCVAWAPTNANQIVSGSQDGPGHNLKLWDVRSSNIPIHNIPGHTGKVLSVDWPTADLIVSGGEDGKLMLHKWNAREEA
jgi:ribosome biogenesis protein YTM1